MCATLNLVFTKTQLWNTRFIRAINPLIYNRKTECAKKICFFLISGFSTPFVINVHTNAVEGSGSPADTNNRGFCLNYIEQPCTATG